MKTLAFRNADQLVLWKYELLGQLSDGHWENSVPHTHWERWHDAEAIVDPDNVGRDFWVQRDRYNFANKDLLDVVAKRMIGYVRIAKSLGAEVLERTELRWSVGCDGELTGYKRDKMGNEDAGMVTRALENPSYTMKDLKRDLKDMGIIIKIRRDLTEENA